MSLVYRVLGYFDLFMVLDKKVDGSPKCIPHPEEDMSLNQISYNRCPDISL